MDYLRHLKRKFCNCNCNKKTILCRWQQKHAESPLKKKKRIPMKTCKQTWQKRVQSRVDLCPRCQHDCLRYATECLHTKQKNMQMIQLKPLTFPSCTVCHNSLPFLVWKKIKIGRKFNCRSRTCTRDAHRCTAASYMSSVLYSHNTSISPCRRTHFSQWVHSCDFNAPPVWFEIGHPLLPGDRLMGLHVRI